AGQHQNARAGLAAHLLDAVADLVAHGLGEHVAVVGPVEGQRADGAVFLVGDLAICHAVSFLHESGSHRSYSRNSAECSPKAGGAERAVPESPSMRMPSPTCGT